MCNWFDWIEFRESIWWETKQNQIDQSTAHACRYRRHQPKIIITAKPSQLRVPVHRLSAICFICFQYSGRKSLDLIDLNLTSVYHWMCARVSGPLLFFCIISCFFFARIYLCQRHFPINFVNWVQFTRPFCSKIESKKRSISEWPIEMHNWDIKQTNPF